MYSEIIKRSAERTGHKQCRIKPGAGMRFLGPALTGKLKITSAVLVKRVDFTNRPWVSATRLARVLNELPIILSKPMK